MMNVSRHHRIAGFVLVEVLAVTAMIGALAAGGGYQYAINKANEAKGVNNLKQIYALLQVQSATDKLPSAAFFPKGNPLQDPRSIVNLVPDAKREMFVSPFAPEALKKKGLTFAWNDTVGGQDLGSIAPDTWLLIDVAAFIADAKLPKPSSYLVLYANGQVVASSSLPPDIVKVVKEAQAKAGKQK